MSGTKSKEMDLTVGSPFWSLLKFAIPVILGNLFQLFYTLADSVIVGKTLGANSLAAVGSTSIIIYFVFCFLLLFSTCYSGFLAFFHFYLDFHFSYLCDAFLTVLNFLFLFCIL